MTRTSRLASIGALLVAVLFAVTPSFRAAADSPYLTPPKVIVDILDAPPTPAALVSPSRDVMALVERRSMPTIAEVSQPMLRLAGQRINPRTNGLHRPGGIVAITFKRIADGAERKVAAPAGAAIQDVSFSPDGKRLAFTVARERGIELWIADTATGQARSLATALNGVGGNPCEWLPDSANLLCSFVPAGRGPAPAAPDVPTGPNIQENAGRPAPVATYQDLLETAHDEALFEYYATAQLEIVDTAKGTRSPVGKPGIGSARPSPNGEFLLVERVKHPFSRLVPVGGFPADVEIWNRQGRVVKKLADQPSSETVPINGVLTGPRAHTWKSSDPATVIWAEALDEGNPRNKVPHRDRVLSLAAPFTGNPTELARTEARYAGIGWTEKGIGLLNETDRPTRRVRTWILDGAAAPRKLWDRKQEDSYGNPGAPVTKTAGIASVIVQQGTSVYLRGEGASPEGDRPFLDRLDLQTLRTERLFQTADKSYESVVALLADTGTSILTRYETPTDPPNYYVRDLGSGSRRAVTSFKDPAPQLAGLTKQLVTYDRRDGVKLSATLYLPPGYKTGERLPMVMWAYPREFTDPSLASQVTGSPYRFTTIGGASHLLLLTQGYAIFDNPTMPIVGPGETANDSYVEQLVASAEAAVDTAVSLGVADRQRIGVGGHSYGAFMTANLLAHSDVFRAGIARSGAYNRTLTPFGFQNERRTFWEVPEIYGRMSPFFNAHRINEPILLIHGEADNNSGTFPIQSERLFMALKGHGATVRYVTLPHEAHGYAARESNFHTITEMLNWMDRWVKNAGPRGTGY
jgi:dipeptidyl aminopeptidase/acylaminoacyl peptidase